MAHRIVPTFQEFDPKFTKDELNFIEIMQSQWGDGPYEESQFDHFYFQLRVSCQDSLGQLIEKGIFMYSPDYSTFDFTVPGWQAYLDLLKKQQAWNEGKRTFSILEKDTFQVDTTKDKFELIKILNDLISMADKSILFQDPYPEPKFIFFFNDANSNVSIKFLTSRKHGKFKLEQTLTILKELQKIKEGIEVKFNNKAHNRRIIIDNEFAWEINASQTTNDIITFTRLKNVEKQIDFFNKDWIQGESLQ
jgi:hypothetical protein